MKRPPQRLCIYPKDASMITGRTLRSSYSLLDRIRKCLRKQPHQAISVKEFCDYIGLAPEEVMCLLE